MFNISNRPCINLNWGSIDKVNSNWCHLLPI